MQQTVHVPAPPRYRGLIAMLSAFVLGLVLPAIASAAIPTVANLSLTLTSPYQIKMSAEVTSNGGSLLWERGFVHALTSDNASPELFAPGTSRITVRVGVGSMTRDLGVVPGFSYSVQAYARNAFGTAYSGVATATAPCPAIVLNALPDSSLGASYGSYADAYGGSGTGYGYAVTSGALPLGLSLDSNTGYVSGTPAAVGTYGFTISAADLSWACGGFRTYSIKITTLDVQPSKIAFPSEVVGGSGSPTAFVTVTNYDSADVSLGSVLSSTPEFAVTGTTCGATLPGLASCTLDIVFTPSSATTFTGNVTMSPALVALRGAGVTSAVSQVYSVNAGGGTVSIIDPVTNVVRKTVVVGSSPGNLQALPGGAKVYVPNQGSSSVSVIDTATYSVTDILSGFDGPHAVAPTPQGNEVWVLNAYSGSISVIDTATAAVAGIPGSGCVATFSEHIVANPVNLEMYVLSSNGNICVFDRGSRGFLRSIPVGGSLVYGLVLPDGSAMYVTGSSGVVTRVALASGALSPVAGASGRNMDMKANGSKVYVAQGENGFGFITTASNTFTAIPLTSPGYLQATAVHDATGRVYVTDANSNAVYVVDLATDTEVPNPEFPIRDSYFSSPRAIAAVKAAGPVGVPPTVTTGAGSGSFATASVTGSVDANGGLPIFERGFAYSTSDPLPSPGAFDVLTMKVSGTLGAMSTTLTGLVSGSTYFFRAYAKNVAGVGLGAAGTFSTLSCPSIAIDPTFLPNASVGAPYSEILTASGATGPYSFTFGALPPGLNGLSTGALSGTPTAAGTFTLQVTATDTPTGCWASAMYDLVVGTPVAAGGVLISEFRTHGPNGTDDEYIEIGNRTSADVVVASTDGSGGWSIGRPGQVIALIPDGTVIPKGGHWLATNVGFSLYFSGIPNSVQSGDRLMVGVDIPDDAGFGLFNTADSGAYAAATRLDAVGGAAELDALFYEGTPLPAVVQAGSANPTAQTAWVRRLTNSAVLTDSEDNNRDFIFVAGDAGTTYGPLGDVAAVLGGPNPEDSKAVHDVLQSEFPVALLDPSVGENSYPNREKFAFYDPRAVEYRRTFTNNTGKEIHALSFKVINLTTLNSRLTIPAQSQLRIVDAAQRSIEAPVGSNVYMDTQATLLENPSSYPLEWYDSSDYVLRKTGGMNSRVIVPFASQLGLQAPNGLKSLSSSIRPSQTVAVNFKTAVITKGYYLFVLVPQVSFDPPKVVQVSAQASAGKP